MEGQVKKKFYKRWWFWVLAVIVFFIIVGSSGSKSSNVSQTSTTQEQAVSEPAVQVTAVKLAADYEANEVSADAKYKGKILEVSGTISNIGKDILDQPYVALADGTQYSITSIQCMFDKSDQAQLATLKKDTKITLSGRGDGKLGNILLRECSIVR